MYLPQISEFSDFLAAKDHTLQEILDYLQRVTLKILDCDAIINFQANEDNVYFVTGTSGISKLAQEVLSAPYNLDENRPVADAINKGEIIWLDRSPQRLEKYPTLKDFPLRIDHLTLIVFPIFRSSTPVSAFVIICHTKMKTNTEAEGFLKVISSIFALHYYQRVLASPQEPKKIVTSNSKISHNESPELTARQNVILRLVSEDRTNASISEILGYSESTIRQEIMKIFSKLGCGNRHQAAEIYKSLKKD